METHIAKAYAKINLSLYITGIRNDGYHLLNSLMQTIDLYDEIGIKKNNGGIRIITESAEIPSDNKNTAFTAAEYMLKNYHIPGGYDISIKKRIPVGAGLGGPSTDAATVIKLINDNEKLGLSFEELKDIGVKIGADVPFFMKGGLCLCEGVGDILTPIDEKTSLYVLLVKPDFSVSSAWAYREFDSIREPAASNSDALIEYIRSSNKNGIGKSLCNDLEYGVVKKYPIIGKIKEKIIRSGAYASLMSGSGSTVFGLFEHREGLKEAKKIFEKEYIHWDIFAVETV